MRRQEAEERTYNYCTPPDNTYSYSNIHGAKMNNPDTLHKTLYQALGYTPTNTPEEIRQKYYRKAFIFHPDKITNPSEEDLQKWDVIRRTGVGSTTKRTKHITTRMETVT